MNSWKVKASVADIQSKRSSSTQSEKQAFDHVFINAFQVVQIYLCPKSWQKKKISFKVKKAEKNSTRQVNKNKKTAEGTLKKIMLKSDNSTDSSQQRKSLTEFPEYHYPPTQH